MSNIRILAKLIKEKDTRSEIQRSIKKSSFDEGNIFTGWFFIWPELNENFTFWEDDKYYTSPIYTTKVLEIIDERRFRTMNTIYRILTVEDERDNKIDNILG
jgi:hypothetical protein